ncbi:MAG: oxygen-independent coproporphyrinogen III oxidase [Vallitaleaceae bacterium]|nr:oxygen-independent coproporphyrinogen III oxidase [Vallitaleaceae bacterium]
MNKSMKGISLYIHIPFCVQKCGYCDFLSFPSHNVNKQIYLKSLHMEMQAYSALINKPVSTIFFGGGTPSTLSVKELSQIFASLESAFDIHKDAEISMEINPGSMKEEHYEWLKNEKKVNRISIGLQTTKNHILKKLGRIHSYEEFLLTYKELRKCGINNINIDLMFALPGQTYKDWKESLQEIVLLQPEHISAYSLILEEGTPFYSLYEKGNLALPTEEEERQMYAYTWKYLEEMGLRQYEISNYAKVGYECKHNLCYWQDGDYLGVGLGAASYIDGIRYENTSDYQAYCEGNFGRVVTMKASEDRRLEERFFLGLRVLEGISLEQLKSEFHDPLQRVYHAAYEKNRKLGLIEVVEDRLRLTRKGIDFSNQVFMDFLLDE